MSDNELDDVIKVKVKVITHCLINEELLDDVIIKTAHVHAWEVDMKITGMKADSWDKN